MPYITHLTGAAFRFILASRSSSSSCARLSPLSMISFDTRSESSTFIVLLPVRNTPSYDHKCIVYIFFSLSLSPQKSLRDWYFTFWRREWKLHAYTRDENEISTVAHRIFFVRIRGSSRAWYTDIIRVRGSNWGPNFTKLSYTDTVRLRNSSSPLHFEFRHNYFNNCFVSCLLRRLFVRFVVFYLFFFLFLYFFFLQ